MCVCGRESRCMCERECVCVCVCERERETDRECVSVYVCMCVCVCVCERERERDRESVCVCRSGGETTAASHSEDSLAHRVRLLICVYVLNGYGDEEPFLHSRRH